MSDRYLASHYSTGSLATSRFSPCIPKKSIKQRLEEILICSERFARSAGLLDRRGQYARLAVEYIGLADLLENHNTPPYSSHDSNWRDTTSFPSWPAYSERLGESSQWDAGSMGDKATSKAGRPQGFWRSGLFRSLGVVSPPTTLSRAMYNHNNSGQTALISPNSIESLWTDYSTWRAREVPVSLMRANRQGRYTRQPF